MWATRNAGSRMGNPLGHNTWTASFESLSKCTHAAELPLELMQLVSPPQWAERHWTNGQKQGRNGPLAQSCNVHVAQYVQLTDAC